MNKKQKIEPKPPIQQELADAVTFDFYSMCDNLKLEIETDPEFKFVIDSLKNLETTNK
mgnify:CR=1 FL=1